MRFLITVLAAAAASLTILTSVAAAGADLSITALDCGSHPRRIRIENLGDAAQDLSGWQLQSDAAEGPSYDLGLVGALGAGAKIFVFQGHLSPPTTPDSGYYRWGSEEIFNLRANDSTDYVRIVDPQGNTINQRNCEGLPPGATPAPTTEFDPPPIVPVVTDAPATPAPATPAPAAPTAAPAAAGQATPAAARGSGPVVAADPNSALPPAGGPPLSGQDLPETLPFAAGTLSLALGILFVSLGRRSPRPRP